EANSVNMNQSKVEQRSEDKKKQEELDRANELKTAINDKKVIIPIKTGEGGRVFGSVTTKEIAESIDANFGVKVDKKKIQLSQPIKAIGTKTVEVKLHAKVTAQVTVETVEAK
ncbi:MAG: 50S ribosomal protein L9, partial [Niameybacter sp.]